MSFGVSISPLTRAQTFSRPSWRLSHEWIWPSRLCQNVGRNSRYVFKSHCSNPTPRVDSPPMGGEGSICLCWYFFLQQSGFIRENDGMGSLYAIDVVLFLWIVHYFIVLRLGRALACFFFWNLLVIFSKLSDEWDIGFYRSDLCIFLFWFFCLSP